MAKFNQEVTEVTEVSFEDIMGDGPRPSLKAIAEVFDVPQQRIYSVAKQPISGQVYDAKVYNWMAITRFITKRIGKEGDEYQNMADVYAAALAKDEEMAANDKRKGSRGTTKQMIEVGDGKTIPARRREVNVGDFIKLKKCDEELEIVYMTETHVVVKGKESPMLNCLSNWTFNQQIEKQ